jgi:hypothetical protein
MKSKIILRMTFLLATAILMVTCTKSDIEKARDAYGPGNIIPYVQGISGPVSVLQTFRFNYSIPYDRSGSTWAWAGVDCVIDSLSADKKKAWVLFSTKPATDTAKVKVIETTSAGIASPEKILKVKVNPFCPLAITGFVGTWSGTDGYTGSQLYAATGVATSSPNTTARTVSIAGLNYMWITDYWGESITAGGTVTMKINTNGTTEIADQYLFTTDYAGDPYIYWIKGTGLWANCGAKPTMVISYNIYYKSDGYTMPSNSDKSKKFVATLVMN